MKIKIILLFIYIGLFLNTYTQSIQTYKFLSNLFRLKIDTTMYFEITREQINDSIFCESGLILGSKDVSFWFKVSNGKWFMKLDNDWQFFFDSVDYINTIFTEWNIDDFKTTIEWRKSVIITEDNYKIYSFDFIPLPTIIEDSADIQWISFLAPPGTYFFNNKDGIIAVMTGDYTWIREDKYDLYEVIR